MCVCVCVCVLFCNIGCTVRVSICKEWRFGVKLRLFLLTFTAQPSCAGMCVKETASEL